MNGILVGRLTQALYEQVSDCPVPPLSAQYHEKSWLMKELGDLLEEDTVAADSEWEWLINRALDFLQIKMVPR